MFACFADGAVVYKDVGLLWRDMKLEIAILRESIDFAYQQKQRNEDDM